MGPPAPSPLPSGHEAWTEKDWERYQHTRLLLRAWDCFCGEHAALRIEQCAPLFAVSVAQPELTGSVLLPGLSPTRTVSDWAASVGLRLDVRRLRDYRARLALDGNVDRRGRAPAGERVAADGEVVATGKRKSDCDPRAWDRFKLLWLTEQQRNVSVCYELVAALARQHGWVWPSQRTIERRVAAELPAGVADYHRRGRWKWDRSRVPCILRDPSETHRPNQMWVGDGHVFDFLCLSAAGKPIRPWLVAWQDFRSRLITGWVIVPAPNSDAILNALRNGILGYGAPLEILVDNGRDYKAKMVTGGKSKAQSPKSKAQISNLESRIPLCASAPLREARFKIDPQRTSSVCARLGITPHFCLDHNPGAKPIEREFGTICEQFSKLQPSWCGNTPFTRPHDFYRELRQGQIDVPTLDEVRQRFADWLPVHHAQPRSGAGMNDRSPLEVFAVEDPLPQRTAPAELLDYLLLPEVRAKVTRHGVQVRGLHYGQSITDLLLLQGQNVLVKYDLANADQVYIHALDGKHLFTAAHDVLRGVNHDDIRQAASRRKAARKLAEAALPAARRAARSLEEEVLHEAIAAQREQVLAATGTDGRTGGAGFQPPCGAGYQPAARPLQLLPAASAWDQLPSAYGRAAPGQLVRQEVADVLDAFEPSPPPAAASADPWDELESTDFADSGGYDDPLDALTSVSSADPEDAA